MIGKCQYTSYRSFKNKKANAETQHWPQSYKPTTTYFSNPNP